MNSNSLNEGVISCTVPKAAELTGLGRSTLFELIRQRKIKSAKIGFRRLILVDSLRDFIGKAAD
jgi:excisionase family DNA binding protein